MLYEQWDYRPVRGCELIAECETSPQIAALQGGYDTRAGCNDCRGNEPQGPPRQCWVALPSSVIVLEAPWVSTG